MATDDDEPMVDCAMLDEALALLEGMTNDEHDNDKRHHHHHQSFTRLIDDECTEAGDKLGSLLDVSTLLSPPPSSNCALTGSPMNISTSNQIGDVPHQTIINSNTQNQLQTTGQVSTTASAIEQQQQASEQMSSNKLQSQSKQSTSYSRRKSEMSQGSTSKGYNLRNNGARQSSSFCATTKGDQLGAPIGIQENERLRGQELSARLQLPATTQQETAIADQVDQSSADKQQQSIVIESQLESGSASQLLQSSQWQSSPSSNQRQQQQQPQIINGSKRQRANHGGSTATGGLSKYRRRTANARERSRMQEINQAFERLKQVVPHNYASLTGNQQLSIMDDNHRQTFDFFSPSTTFDSSSTCGDESSSLSSLSSSSSTSPSSTGPSGAATSRLTKITTLRLAVHYIAALSDILKQSPATSSSSSNSNPNSNLTSTNFSAENAQNGALTKTNPPTGAASTQSVPNSNVVIAKSPVNTQQKRRPDLGNTAKASAPNKLQSTKQANNLSIKCSSARGATKRLKCSSSSIDSDRSNLSSGNQSSLQQSTAISNQPQQQQGKKANKNNKTTTRTTSRSSRQRNVKIAPDAAAVVGGVSANCNSLQITPTPTQTNINDCANIANVSPTSAIDTITNTITSAQSAPYQQQQQHHHHHQAFNECRTNQSLISESQPMSTPICESSVVQQTTSAMQPTAMNNAVQQARSIPITATLTTTPVAVRVAAGGAGVNSTSNGAMPITATLAGPLQAQMTSHQAVASLAQAQAHQANQVTGPILTLAGGHQAGASKHQEPVTLAIVGCIPRFLLSTSGAHNESTANSNVQNSANFASTAQHVFLYQAPASNSSTTTGMNQQNNINFVHQGYAHTMQSNSQSVIPSISLSQPTIANQHQHQMNQQQQQQQQQSIRFHMPQISIARDQAIVTPSATTGAMQGLQMQVQMQMQAQTNDQQRTNNFSVSQTVDTANNQQQQQQSINPEHQINLIKSMLLMGATESGDKGVTPPTQTDAGRVVVATIGNQKQQQQVQFTATNGNDYQRQQQQNSPVQKRTYRFHNYDGTQLYHQIAQQQLHNQNQSQARLKQQQQQQDEQQRQQLQIRPSSVASMSPSSVSSSSSSFVSSACGSMSSSSSSGGMTHVATPNCDSSLMGATITSGSNSTMSSSGALTVQATSIFGDELGLEQSLVSEFEHGQYQDNTDDDGDDHNEPICMPASASFRETFKDLYTSPYGDSVCLPSWRPLSGNQQLNNTNNIDSTTTTTGDGSDDGANNGDHNVTSPLLAPFDAGISGVTGADNERDLFNFGLHEALIMDELMS